MQEIVRSGVLGEIRGFTAELCEDKTPAVTADPSHRLINPALAGGALLDLGPYAWLQAALVLLPPSKASLEPIPVPKVVAHMTKTSTGVDKSTTFIVELPQADGTIVPAVLTAGQDRASSLNRVVLIAGSKGYLEVQAPSWRPKSISYKAWDTVEEYLAEDQKPPSKDEIFHFDRPGSSSSFSFLRVDTDALLSFAGGIWGMAFEADEVARCLRDGKKESDRMPLRETILQMQVRLSSLVLLSGLSSLSSLSSLWRSCHPRFAKRF
jgi:predicted dehydrogenase